MRHYRPMTRAQRDAVQERKAERMHEAGIEPRPMLPPREPARIRTRVDGQLFDAQGEPAKRSGQFDWTLNGESIGVGGLEHAWRSIQKRRVPMLGERNLL